MSDQVLPTEKQAEHAFAYMLDQIHVPAFFEKLAANGIAPRNEAESQQLLKIGAALAQKETEHATKTAGDGNDFLTHCLGRLGVDEQPAVNVETHVKAGADALVGQNDMAKTAALIYAHVTSGGGMAKDAPAA